MVRKDSLVRVPSLLPLMRFIISSGLRVDNSLIAKAVTKLERLIASVVNNVQANRITELLSRVAALEAKHK